MQSAATAIPSQSQARTGSRRRETAIRCRPCERTSMLESAPSREARAARRPTWRRVRSNQGAPTATRLRSCGDFADRAPSARRPRAGSRSRRPASPAPRRALSSPSKPAMPAETRGRRRRPIPGRGGIHSLVLRFACSAARRAGRSSRSAARACSTEQRRDRTLLRQSPRDSKGHRRRPMPRSAPLAIAARQAAMDNSPRIGEIGVGAEIIRSRSRLSFSPFAPDYNMSRCPCAIFAERSRSIVPSASSSPSADKSGRG